MAFEVFKETGVRSQEFISITETKAFGLSRAFIERHRITSSQKAVVLFDPLTKQIALHFSGWEPKIGFAVRIPNPKHGGTVAARSFFDIKLPDFRRYSGRYDDPPQISLRSIGIDRAGDAFLIKLKENVKYKDDIIDDTPIDLSTVPF